MKQEVRLFRQLFPRHLVVSLLLSLVVGCASATTQKTAGVVGKTLPRPPELLIYDFAVASDDAPPSEEIERHRAIAKAFSEEVVIKLEGVGIPAQRATDSTTVPLHAVVVKGQFVMIRKGSRTRRMLIGFGAGSTMLRVQIQAYQMMESGLERIKEVEGQARGSRMPGVAAGGGRNWRDRQCGPGVGSRRDGHRQGGQGRHQSRLASAGPAVRLRNDRVLLPPRVALAERQKKAVGSK